MRQPGAQVQDVAELEKILKRPITLHDITHGTIFNSGKYRTGRFEEIEMVVHNGHAFPRNHHFPGDRMVEYYKGDEWKAINKALQESPQAVWLIGTGYNHEAIVDTLEEEHTVSQFVLEDGRTFRTWKKHTDIIKIWAFCNRKGGNCREKPILHLYAKYDFWAEICPEIVLTQKKIFPAVSPLFIAKGPYNFHLMNLLLNQNM